MANIIKLGLASHSSSSRASLKTIFDAEDDIQCSLIVLKPDSGYPEQAELDNVDVLLFAVGENWQLVIEAVLEMAEQHRPAIVFTGPVDGAEVIRLAFKAGAHDYIDEQMDSSTLVQAIHQADKAQRQARDKGKGDLTLFVSPQGGAGTTTLAVNLAHVLSARAAQPSVLAMDMDIQYGNLPISFNEKPSTQLAAAISNGETIDEAIIDACLYNKGKNPQVLATYSDELISPWDINPLQIDTLLTLLAKRYDHIIVDMPRSIDPITFHALERADRICIVVQQSISDIRVTSLYIRLLQDQGIASDTICLVINRHESGNIIRNQDIEAAFGAHEIFVVPNDFKRVSNAADHSTPIIARFKKALITKSLMKLSQELWVTDVQPEKWSFGGFGKSKKAA